MRHFHEQLQQLFQRIMVMGSLAETMIRSAVRNLVEQSEALTDEVYAMEAQVNALQVEVDDQAVKLTILQQPVAQDARFLFMVSRIGGELERIADQAINICQNVHYVVASPTAKVLVDLPVMAGLAQAMVRDGLTAMVNRDVALAGRILEEEKKVDAFRDRIFRLLLSQMRDNPQMVQQALSLILIARNLERIGDHATNIAEEVIYWIEGRDIRHSKARKISPTVGAAAAQNPPDQTEHR